MIRSTGIPALAAASLLAGAAAAQDHGAIGDYDAWLQERGGVLHVEPQGHPFYPPPQREYRPPSPPAFESLAALYGYEDDWRDRAIRDLASGRIDRYGTVYAPLSPRTARGSER